MATEARFSGPEVARGSSAVDAASCMDSEPSDTFPAEDKDPERQAELSKSPPKKISFSINSILQDAANPLRDLDQADGARIVAPTDAAGTSGTENNDFAQLSFFYRDKLVGTEKLQTSSSEAERSADALISSWTMPPTSPFIYRE